MVFSSLTFILFLFLCLLVQGFCPKTRKKNTALLVFSLIFYLWGGLFGLLLLVAVSAVNWFLALQIEGQKKPNARKALLFAAVALNAVAFCVIRFYEVLPQTGEGTLAGRYLIPMGYAFYTLQLISYLIDVYRGTIKAQKKFTTVLLYSSLFAQSAGGPIVRFGDVQKALKARKLRASAISRGIMRFTCGLAKKVILADACGTAVTQLLGEDVNALASAPLLGVWLGSAFFMLQLFLELSAYADMAVGIGLLLGFRFPENFDFPFVADTLRGFWSRWNQTVIAFFRDYVYLPLGGQTQAGVLAVLNLLITGLLVGFWCGSGANMMIWAAYCVVVLMIESYLLGGLQAIHPVLKHIWVLGTMLIGFVLFRYSDLGMMIVALKGLFGLNGAGLASIEVFKVLFGGLPLLVVSIIAATPLTRVAGAYMREQAKLDVNWMRIRGIVTVVCPTVLLLLSVMAMVGNQTVGFAFFGF